MNSIRGEEINILVHHHTIAFEQDGKIWLQSSIGFWIDELSNYFNKIGLLLFVSDKKKSNQDYCLKNKNIYLHQLGIEGQLGRLHRNLKVKKVCRKISPHYNCLVIRGITPRQLLVYNNCEAKIKIFYFVGSLFDSKPKFRIGWIHFIQRFMFHLRRAQLRSIFKSSYVLSNSPGTVDEIKYKYGKVASFAPTSTLSKDFYSFRPYFISQGTIKLLFCGRIAEDKGIEVLLNAIKILKERHMLCHLKVIGTGPAKYLDRLHDILLKGSISDRVQFVGFTDFGEGLINLYKEANIFILPTFHEGFPRTIWEAAASCTPVITTAVGGIKSLVSDKDVFFVSPNSSEEIADTTEFIIRNPHIAARKVQSAYQLALNYTSEHCAENFAKLVISFFNETCQNINR